MNKAAISNEKKTHTLSKTCNMTVLPGESVGESWLLFGEALSDGFNGFGTEPKHQTVLNHHQTPTDILQSDITPEYHIHHSLSSLCTPKNTHTYSFKLSALGFPLPLILVR